MNKVELNTWKQARAAEQAKITKPLNEILAMAFREGSECGTAARLIGTPAAKYGIKNKYSSRGFMPEAGTKTAAQWDAFSAGVSRAYGEIKNAGTSMRNSRFNMGRAIARGLV